MFTRDIAKKCAKLTVTSVAADAASDIIVDHTGLEEEDLRVRIPSTAVGMMVANYVEPLTDKMVDKAADWLNAKREARKAKKEETV